MELVAERTFRRILFVALLLGAPAVLFLIQVVFVVPTVLLLAGAVRMVPKLVASGFARENLAFVLLLLAGALIFAGLCYLIAWLFGKLAARLPAGRPRLALLGVLLAGLVWVTQQPIYGGGGHGPGKFGPLQELLGSLDKSFGAGTTLTVYLVALALVLLPLALAGWRARRNARARAGS
jgi:hypothetical protein